MAAVAATPSVDELESIGLAAGLDAVGVTSADPFDDARRILDERKAAGLSADMQFTYRNPARSTDPSATVAGARSLVVGARRYRESDPAPPAVAAGAVARYARADHYGALRAALGAVADRLRDDGWRARVLCDDNALVDRAAAHRAGLGWFGKNANLLLPGQGSWFVLGSVVTDAPLEIDAVAPVADGCGACTRCIDGCPTGAIVAPGVVDARRCLAWLVQTSGTFPLEHRVALGGRLYGCDDCQEVCPPNRLADRRGDSVDRDAGEQAWVPLVALLASTDEELLARHGRWYIAERDPRWLRRNALVALGNVGDPGDADVLAALDRYAGGDDAVLAEHARWARTHLRSCRDVGPTRAHIATRTGRGGS
jgi:epoxyqueuosine reductase